MKVEQFEIRPSKIDAYLLAVDHPDGGSNARFFLGKGFRTDDARILADALVQHAIQYWPGTTISTSYGVKHRISGPMPCPDGNTTDILAIWKVETGSAIASFVTAYPFKARSARSG